MTGRAAVIAALLVLGGCEEREDGALTRLLDFVWNEVVVTFAVTDHGASKWDVRWKLAGGVEAYLESQPTNESKRILWVTCSDAGEIELSVVGWGVMIGSWRSADRSEKTVTVRIRSTGRRTRTYTEAWRESVEAVRAIDGRRTLARLCAGTEAEVSADRGKLRAAVGFKTNGCRELKKIPIDRLCPRE